MTTHFDIRRDVTGWTVFDRWTGRTVVLERAEKRGLSKEDAEHLAASLNYRDAAGDRTIRQ